MHGWSFGGFQTQMCLYMAPDVFQVGIAGAGPTEWENYNSWYSTGTIGKSREGKTDLAKYSLLPLAKNLKGKLLLVHGMAMRDEARRRLRGCLRVLHRRGSPHRVRPRRQLRRHQRRRELAQ